MMARTALKVIRRCVVADRFTVSPHFVHRMAERVLVWPDIVAVVGSPDSVRSGGRDRWARPKWLISGTAADELPIEVVCVLDEDEREDVTVFITAA